MKLMREPRHEGEVSRRVRTHLVRQRAKMSGGAAAPGTLVRSVAFRQAVIYAVFFSFSVLLLSGFFYWSTAGYLTRQVEATIEAEQGALAERYRTQGLAGLTSFISARLARQPAGPEIYLLAAPDYRPLVGNLSGWPDATPDSDGWVRFRLGDAAQPEVHWASAKVFSLQGGYNLLVGRDMQELDAIRETIVRALVWGVVFVVAMALVGGALMSRSMSKRVRDMNQTIRRIMAGDLSQRMPSDESGDEFDQLTDNLNRMLDRIEGSMDGVRQVSDNIAHDLKTPLARMRNRLEELQQQLGDGADDARDAVDAAIAEADALLGTFGALLRIARIEAAAQRAGFATVDLAPLLGDVAELYEPLAEARQQTMEVDESASMQVYGDRDLIFQALANLVDNAIKYAPPAGKVSLRLAEQDGRAVVTVADNGIGIPAVDRDKVFERFWRGDDSRSTPGSGLGLSLTRAVAALHGIDIGLYDAAPGLRVELRFPVTT